VQSGVRRCVSHRVYSPNQSASYNSPHFLHLCSMFFLVHYPVPSHFLVNANVLPWVTTYRSSRFFFPTRPVPDLLHGTHTSLTRSIRPYVRTTSPSKIVNARMTDPPCSFKCSPASSSSPSSFPSIYVSLAQYHTNHIPPRPVPPPSPIYCRYIFCPLI